MKNTTRKVLVFVVILAAALLAIVPFLASAEGLTPTAGIDLLGIVQQYAVIPVTVFCLAVGWILKHAFEEFNNKYIPLILVPAGIIAVLWTNSWSVTPETVFAGFCSAVFAVYLHSTGKHLFADKETKPPEQ